MSHTIYEDPDKKCPCGDCWRSRIRNNWLAWWLFREWSLGKLTMTVSEGKGIRS